MRPCILRPPRHYSRAKQHQTPRCRCRRVGAGRRGCLHSSACTRGCATCIVAHARVNAARLCIRGCPRHASAPTRLRARLRDACMRLRARLHYARAGVDASARLSCACTKPAVRAANRACIHTLACMHTDESVYAYTLSCVCTRAAVRASSYSCHPRRGTTSRGQSM
jgi:hypothetical protein